jgi:hypothetical protein
MPRFSKGFDFVSEQKSLRSMLFKIRLCILFLSNYNKTPRKFKVYASVFRGVSLCLGAEKLMLCTFKMYIIYTPICASFITIFVQERERGRYNRARDRASGEPRQSRGARGARLSTGRATWSVALMPIHIRRSQFGLKAPFGPRLQLPALPLIRFNQACCLETSILPSAW